MTNDGLRGVAYHEAGHAVVALALGLSVARVEIFHEDNSGVTDIAGADGLPLVDHIALFVAGMNAEKMFDAPTHKSAGGGDRANVRELLKGIDIVPAHELRQKGHQRAWDLLNDHHSSVNDIAERLIAHRKIDLAGYVLKR
jgi:Peptidase M50B-like